MKRTGRRAAGLYAGGSLRLRLTGYALTGALFTFGVVMVGALTVAERLLGDLDEPAPR